MRMRRCLSQVKRQEGATLAVVALSMTLILGMAALTVDFGSSFAKRRSIVNANDSAALGFAIWCATGKGDLTQDSTADNTATANTSDAVRKTGSSSTWPVTGKCVPGAADNHGSVSVSYQGAAQQFFRPILGGSSSQTVVGQAKAAWGAAGGAGGVLPAALSMGKLSTCKIPGTGKGTECWFYVDNSALGNATWGLMNVQPTCTDTKYGWNVTHAACQTKVGLPDPTYKCPSFSAQELRDIIQNGSPALTVNYPNPTYVCTVPGAKTTDYANIKALEGKTRLFPVNDQSKQIKSGGIPCLWPACVPDFYDIVGFIEMQIVNVWKGTDPGWDVVHCPGVKGNNAWCLHGIWVSFTTEPGPICDSCENFGVEAVELRG